MSFNFYIVEQKVSGMISSPEFGLAVAGSTGVIGALNTFAKEFPAIHDGISLIAMSLGCVLSYMIIRINIVKLRITQIELRERQIKMLRLELDTQLDESDED